MALAGTMVVTGAAHADPMPGDWNVSPSVSADGRYVVFSSDSYTGPADDGPKLFVQDQLDGSIRRAADVPIPSHRFCLFFEAEQGCQSESLETTISDDGSSVGYASLAGRIFVIDVSSGESARVDVTPTGDAADAPSSAPVLSGDGRFIAFASSAGNLVGSDTNGMSDVFVRDIASGSTTRVSVSSSGTQANGWSEAPHISRNGRFIVFASRASNLTGGDANGAQDIFIHDRVERTTSLVSIDANGAQFPGSSSYPYVSDDGRSVAFTTYAPQAFADPLIGPVGFAAEKSAGSTTTITIGPDGVAAGSTILIAFSMDDASGVVTAQDSRGNTYYVDANAQHVEHVRTAILSARRISQPLAPGDTITVFSPVARARTLAAFAFKGVILGTSAPRATATGTGSSPATGAIPTWATTNLLFGAVGVEGASQETFVAGNGFGIAGRVGTTGSSATSNVTTNAVYRVGQQEAVASQISPARDWAAAAAGYSLDLEEVPATAYVRDLSAGMTTSLGNATSRSISGDGGSVLLETEAGNYVHDLSTGVRLNAGSGAGAAMSRDASTVSRWVEYEGSSSQSIYSRVWTRDIASGIETTDPSTDIQPLTTNDGLRRHQWAVVRTRVRQGWRELDSDASGISVAVIDTGVDLQHPDLACPSKMDVVPGADVIRDGNGPDDVVGHGTHVAGIIGACSNNAAGIAGVARAATLMPIQVFDGERRASFADVARAIDLATSEGAHVINLSLAPAIGPTSYVPELFREVDAAISRAVAAGVVVVAADGNDAMPICEYPSLADDVLCVGATDSQDLKTWYSTFPNKLDGVKPGPGLVAPGGDESITCNTPDKNILSLFPIEFDTCDDGMLGYRTSSGTSMAAGHVSGTAAVLYGRLGGSRTLENGASVRDLIISTADDLGSPGFDPVYGWGRLNFQSAVRMTKYDLSH